MARISKKEQEALADKKYKEIEKQKRIKRQISKFRKIFKDNNIDKDMTTTTLSLVENASFMIVTLEDLRDVINAHGVTSEYQNGENQWGTKKAPEVEVYNTMVKHYMTIMKQITDLMPKGEVEGLGDDFDKF